MAAALGVAVGVEPELDELLQAATSTASGIRAAAVAKRVRLLTGEYSFNHAR
jgi:hypothetical protein